MASAAQSVGQVGDALDAVGPSATAAGEKIEAAGELSGKAMREAKGEAGLLGEMFGIHLPRHVRSFVAELPGVGAALSAAFAATAVLFLIEALAKGVEKIQEWAEEAHKTALAWDEFNTAVANSFRGLDDKLLEAGIKMDELKGDHVDALRKAIELIDHTSLHELEQQFGLLSKAADAMFEQLKTSWYSLDAGSKGALNALTDFKAQYDLLLAEGKKKEASDLLAGTLESAKKTLETMKAAKEEAEQATTVEEVGGGPGEKALQSQELLVRALNAQVIVQQKIAELAKDETFIKQTEEGKRAAEERATEEKRALDAQLANIETWKAEQHAAYESGKTDLATWLAAEVHASDAAAIAHESYLQKLIGLYIRSGQAIKAHQTAEELATLQMKDAAKATDELASAMNKHHEATRKVVEEYARLVDAGVVKDFEATAKAAERLTLAEQELEKAQSKLAEDKLSQHYKDQETAITKLAQMHLITEEQKDDRLKLLEQQQANAAIAILNDQLAKQQAAIVAAQAKIAGLKISIGVSPEQVLEAEAYLKKLETAVTNTQAQIVQTQEKFNKQSEADDKSHYGRALLLAISYGNEILAEQLKQNHAALVAAEQELAEAKARGANTTAIEQEIKALKQSEQALEKEANGGKLLTVEKQKEIQQAVLSAQALIADAKARGLDTAAMQQQLVALQKLQVLMQKEPAQMNQVKGAMQGLRLATAQLKDEMKAMEQQMSQAFATAIMGALESGKSIGQHSKRRQNRFCCSSRPRPSRTRFTTRRRASPIPSGTQRVPLPILRPRPPSQLLLARPAESAWPSPAAEVAAATQLQPVPPSPRPRPRAAAVPKSLTHRPNSQPAASSRSPPRS